MKKALKTQLSAAVAMMLVAAIALTGATYAWFTAIANPDVESIDLYVKAADTLMLSALSDPEINTADSWKVTVTKDEITGAARGNQTDAFPSQMLNVSTLFNDTSNGFFTVSHASQGAINGYTSTSQATNFAKFSLWVKSTKSGYIYLDTGSQVLPSAGSASVPKSGIADTVRVGIVPVNSGTEDWTKAVIWEPNSTAHVSTDYYGPGDDITTKLSTSAVKSAVAAPGTAPALAAAVAAQTTYDFQNDGTNITNDAGKIGLFDYTTSEAGNKQQFNVYIWVEGADQDTVNAVAKSTFSTYLKFGQGSTTLAVAQEVE